MNSITRTAGFFSLSLALGLAGCETIRVHEASGRAADEQKTASAVAESMRNRVSAHQDTVTFSDSPWVSTKPLTVKRGLPPALDCEVAYNESKTLQQFAEWVSSACGLPVRVSPDALDGGASLRAAAAASGGNRGAGPQAPAPAAASGGSIDDLFPTGSSSSAVAAGASSSGTYYQGYRARALRFEGRLSELLDTVTGSMGLSWRYDQDQRVIKIFYYETRTFQVYTLNKKTTFNSTVKAGMSSSAGVSGTGGQGTTGSTGVSGDSGSTQTTTTEITGTVAEDIENTVRSMLSLNRMAYAKATGTISITDRPDILDRVQTYLDAENATITKQVLFNMEILSVTLNNKDQYGIDWNLVYQSSKGGFGLKNTFPGMDSSAVGGSFNILDTGSPWNGSKLLIQALSQQGTVVSRQQPSITTLNLQAAPVQIGRVNGFLAASQTTSSANVGATTALTPGSITSGFNMSMLPFVLPDNRMLLQLTLSMIGQPEFETFTSGDSSIQNPDYGIQIFDQNVKLKSGQTLVISGFDQSTENSSKSGTGSASNFLFGGGGTRDSNREVIVLMITPVVME
jgi:type IVB pilus formation R64 PilN family outer membrane protein